LHGIFGHGRREGLVAAPVGVARKVPQEFIPPCFRTAEALRQAVDRQPDERHQRRDELLLAHGALLAVLLAPDRLLDLGRGLGLRYLNSGRSGRGW